MRVKRNKNSRLQEENLANIFELSIKDAISVLRCKWVSFKPEANHSFYYDTCVGVCSD